VPSLIEREKWDQSARPLSVHGSAINFSLWTRILSLGNGLCDSDVGSVTSTHPSSYGVVQKATVKTALSTLIRHVVKLCFIAGGEQN
jgi:hypothetical protein